ncbi:hypothetical protein NUSPORA_02879 [Nucleospora cyclopteri]
MLTEIESRIFNLSQDVKSLNKKPADFSNKIKNEIIALDSILETIQIPKELEEIYSTVKLAYLSKYTNHRYYNTVRRNEKIKRINEDATEIAEITDYINSHVISQTELIDSLNDHLFNINRDATRAVEELNTANDNLKRKLRFYRIMYLLMVIFILYYTYKIFK